MESLASLNDFTDWFLYVVSNLLWLTSTILQLCSVTNSWLAVLVLRKSDMQSVEKLNTKIIKVTITNVVSDANNRTNTCVIEMLERMIVLFAVC